MSSFVKTNRSKQTYDLVKDPKSLALLLLIAIRARIEDGYEMHNGVTIYLEAGEALVGDYKSCGLTRQEYRTCIDRLVKMGLISIRTTPKGTIAKLISDTVFDINLNDYQLTKMQPTNNQQLNLQNNQQNNQQNNSITDSKLVSYETICKQGNQQSNQQNNQQGIEKSTTNKNKRIYKNNIYSDFVEEIYNLYPSKDVNNNNRSTSKGSKDRAKIQKILKTGYPLKKAVQNYLAECAKNKTFLKNLSVFLNNLPDEKELNECAPIEVSEQLPYFRKFAND